MVIEDRAEERHIRRARADLRALVGVGHRGVGALGDERVELTSAPRRQLLREHGEQQVRVVVPRPIGNDGEHSRVRRYDAKRVAYRARRSAALSTGTRYQTHRVRIAPWLDRL